MLFWLVDCHVEKGSLLCHVDKISNEEKKRNQKFALGNKNTRVGISVLF